MTDTDAPEKLTINGQEFDPEDAARLIELGSKWENTERDQNVKLDTIWPEYTKTSQKVKGLEDSLAEREAKLAEYDRKAAEAEARKNAPEDAEAIRANARKYGIVDKQLLKDEGYLTKAEVEDMLSSRRNLDIAADKILKDGQKLEKEIDGSDGRVPFDLDAVLTYAGAKGINDLQEAYKTLNHKANAKWEEAQIERAQRPGMTTLKGTGAKAPKDVKITDSNFKDSLTEALYGAKE